MPPDFASIARLYWRPIETGRIYATVIFKIYLTSKNLNLVACGTCNAGSLRGTYRKKLAW
ncbi:hypothetical protein PSPTOT1_2835 [Pseudomonas syringae pv. tomato T1]|nr:hypothetical protein PSPTOT1_2835 [Pseudomonas syringae pv. tomato T1]